MTERTNRSEDRLAYADLQVLSIDENARTVDYVMSDDSVDSYGEIVEQKWRLDRFRKNPVVLYGHNRANGWLGSLSQQETLPIGRIVKGPKLDGNKQTGKRLVGTVEFAPEEVSEFAEQVWNHVRSGFLKGGSVGFYPHDVRRETHDDHERFILSDNELFEFSICPIGANANAVANSTEQSREARRQYLTKRADECIQRTLDFEDDDSTAASGQETSDMTEAEFKAKVAALEAQLETAKTNEKAANEKAEAAQKQATESAELTTKAEGERDAAKAELATAQESITTLTTERDEANEKAAQFEDEAIDAELKALVGVKFHAAELEIMRADRKREGKDDFAKRIAARADISTGKQKIAADTSPSTLPEPSTEVPGQKTSEALNKAS